jgi:hypothetical protein
MSTTPLGEFAHKVRAADRVGFGDLRRLRRDILPGGPTTRDEVETLLAIDAAVGRFDRGWMPYLASALREFVAAMPGGAGEDALDWLRPLLARSPARTCAAIAREFVLEAPAWAEALGLAAPKLRGRRRVAEPSAAPQEQRALES